MNAKYFSHFRLCVNKESINFSHLVGEADKHVCGILQRRSKSNSNLITTLQSPRFFFTSSRSSTLGHTTSSSKPRLFALCLSSWPPAAGARSSDEGEESVCFAFLLLAAFLRQLATAGLLHALGFCHRLSHSPVFFLPCVLLSRAWLPLPHSLLPKISNRKPT